MRSLVFTAFAIFLIGLSACNSGGSSMTRATGIAYEVIVVMDKIDWDGAAGTAIKEELTSPIPFLPQPESFMRYTYARPDQFDGLLRYVRNILIINIDKDLYTKTSLLKETNKWARGQLVMYLNTPDVQSLETYLLENPRIIVNHYDKEEKIRMREVLYQTYSQVVMDKAKERFDITINAPSDITSLGESEYGLWFSNNAAVGRMDLLIYAFPFTDKNTFTLDYLVAKRDSFVKEMVPGSFEGSYMSTEKRVVDYFASSLHGKYCGVLRGLWRMEGGDMMGGPFISYARVDEKNKRIIVTEGFVYEPARDKRNYIRRLEAALQTVRFPDEQKESEEKTEENDNKEE